MLRTILLILIYAASCAALCGQTAVNWHCESTDTVAIQRMIGRAAGLPAEGRRVAIGRMMLGTPYGAGTLEKTPERLTVNLDTLDCTTFVDNVLAIDRCVADRRLSWCDYLRYLAGMRYLHGRVDGYASRLHYVSMWAVDNSSRGNIIEVTASLPGAAVCDKTLDFMTTHRDLYPALADSAAYARLVALESGYRNHRYSYVPTAKVTPRVLAMLRPGDIVAFTSRVGGLDVAHLGVITIVDGVPHLMHASSKAGKVVIEPCPLADYLRRNRAFTGIRIFR